MFQKRYRVFVGTDDDGAVHRCGAKNGKLGYALH